MSIKDSIIDALKVLKCTSVKSKQLHEKLLRKEKSKNNHDQYKKDNNITLK